MALRNGAATSGTERHTCVTIAVTVLIALALACAVVSCAPLPDPEPLDAAICTVTDGDTIRCGEERIRLLGIDAPEISACREGRQCVAGDGQASRAQLVTLTEGRALTVRRIGQDRYGRTLGVVYADGANTSCAMIAAGQAEYVARWDNLGAVRADCSDLVT